MNRFSFMSAAHAEIVRKHLVMVLVSIAMSALTSTSLGATPARYPLKLAAPGSRNLVDQDNRPFLFWGEAAWSLLAQPKLNDALVYLTDRREKGVNVVMVSLIEHKFAARAPANANGDLPFTGRPFATPNPAYFSHADQVIAAAAERNMIVLLAPVYLGISCASEGWCAEVQNATAAELRAWGRFLGQRYASFDNVIWMIGGDADPVPVRDKLREVVNGIREFDTRHLLTAHNAPESFAVTPWPNEPWLSINNFYTYSSALYAASLQAYQRTPVMPFFQLESTYENEHDATPQSLRAQIYWTMLSGAFGQTFGNCPIWNFGFNAGFCATSDWKAQLNSPGSRALGHAQTLFSSRPWHTLTPDVHHTSLIAGYGTFGTPDYVTAARASDGATLIAYLPSARTITVQLGTVSGDSANAWWFNPSTGASTFVGTLTSSGLKSFSPPAAGDWVLVLDDRDRNFSAPGTATAVPSTRRRELFVLGIALLVAGVLALRERRGRQVESA